MDSEIGAQDFKATIDELVSKGRSGKEEIMLFVRAQGSGIPSRYGGGHRQIALEQAVKDGYVAKVVPLARFHVGSFSLDQLPLVGQMGVHYELTEMGRNIAAEADKYVKANLGKFFGY